MVINDYMDVHCKRNDPCWQIKFGEALDFTEWSMLKVCAKCIYFKGEKEKEEDL